MVEISKTFELNCEELDKDHQHLVEMVNGIVEMLDGDNTENCQKMVLDFITYTKAHFKREEQFLSKAGYPDIDNHRVHHRLLDEKMEHLLEFAAMVDANDMARESLKKELVYFVMDDVITTDMDFKSFVGDKPG